MPPALQVLSKYGALWQHMFRLRRVQLGLQEAWAALQVRCQLHPHMHVVWLTSGLRFCTKQSTSTYIVYIPKNLQALQHRKAGDDSLPRVPAALRAALSQERQQQHHFVRQARCSARHACICSVYVCKFCMNATVEEQEIAR